MKKKIILIAITLFIGSLCFSQDFAIIVNKATSVENISSSDIKNIFLGKKTTWDDGSSVLPVVLKDDAIQKVFLKAAVKKSPVQFATFWKKAIFTGTGTPPKEFATDDEVKKFVASTPGAIAYISAEALDDTVKKILIQ